MTTNEKTEDCELKDCPATVFGRDEHEPEACPCDQCVWRATQRDKARKIRERAKEKVNCDLGV